MHVHSLDRFANELVERISFLWDFMPISCSLYCPLIENNQCPKSLWNGWVEKKGYHSQLGNQTSQSLLGRGFLKI